MLTDRHTIDLNSIDLERFNIKPGVANDVPVFLIVPKPTTMWDWRPEELKLRSLLVDHDGKVLSAGFPKFFNVGERPDDDAVLAKGLAAGDSIINDKHDGTLIIRSVINGAVHFRTRGQHNLGEFNASVRALAVGTWLMDPDACRECSALLEYCAPNNQIVLRYEAPVLRMLAWVDLRNLVLSPYGAHQHQWPSDLSELIRSQSARVGAEGVVVWTRVDDGCGWLLTKVKTDEYLKLHSLRTMMTAEKARAICACAEVQSIEDARKAFAAIGIDWETFAVAHHLVNEYIDRRHSNRAALKAIINGARGDIARALKASATKAGRDDLFSAAIYATTGQEERSQLALQAVDIGTSANKAKKLIGDMRALSGVS